MSSLSQPLVEDVEAGVPQQKTSWPRWAQAATCVTACLAVVGIVMAGVAINGQTSSTGPAPAGNSLQAIQEQQNLNTHKAQANTLSSKIGNVVTATPFCTSAGVVGYKICQDVVDTATNLITAIEDPTISDEDLLELVKSGKLNSHEGRYSRAVMTVKGENEAAKIEVGGGLAKALDTVTQANIASTKDCFYKWEDSVCIAFEAVDPSLPECAVIKTGPKAGLPQDDSCEVFPVVHLTNAVTSTGRRRGAAGRRIGGAIYGGILGYSSGGAAGILEGAIHGLAAAW